MKLSIAIVNWNSRDYLRRCISSIAAAVLPPCWEAEVVVVDNASADDSLDRLDAGRVALKVIRNIANVGFGAACNQAVASSRGELLLLLNPDTRLSRNCLVTAIEYMVSHPEIGIIGARMTGEDGHTLRHCSRFMKPRHVIFKAFGVDVLFPSLGHFMAEWDHSESREVDHVMAAFFLVRREVFDAVGGFDEGFFLYYEDLDFSLRARQCGWRSMYLAEAAIFHAGGGSSRQILDKRLFYSLRSRLRYAEKHFPPFPRALCEFATMAVEPVSRLVQLAARRRWSEIVQLRRAYRMLYSHFL